jgi:two-component system, chemotaxis family, CheB/CheR fusion protein
MRKQAVSRAPAKSRPAASAPHAPLRQSQRPFPIVGIGASAGGLEAFRQLLGALPADNGMAYVLVQHLDPRHESILAELLSHTTKMPVSEVKGDILVEPNRVYVIPPSQDIGIVDGMLKLVPRSQTGRPHMPIDYFLRTLAEVQGRQGIGVVLSGTATDGTLGLKAIKAEGGIAFAQDPSSAQFDGMPRSAIGAGCVDFVLPPEGIAQELTRLGRHPYMAAGEPRALAGGASVATDEEDKRSLSQIFALLREGSGADFGAYKKTTLRRRIARRMLVNRIETLGAYARHLEGDASEIHALYQDCLITVTSFFRDPSVFEALGEQVFPLLLKDRAPDAPLRVWVPGCATGEEVYSIAIGLLERAGELSRNPSLQIFATDLSESALEKARAGVYLANIAQDVSAERLERFFTEVDGHYQISKAVRETCVFAHHDLANDPPFSRMDLISCRNVLIYMEPHLQERVFATFHYALNPGGFLVLGTSESVGASSAFLAPLDEKRRIYSRKKTAGSPRPSLAGGAYGAGGRAKLPPLTPQAAVPPGIPAEADHMLLARYAPPSVVVDDGLEILEFRGDTHPFLEHGRGQASLNLFRMARKGLLLQLRQTIQEARRRNAPSRKEGLRLRYRGQLRDVNLEVVPLTGAAERCLLVVFETLPASRRRAKGSALPPGRAAAAGNRESARLRQQLAEAAQALKTVMEEHDAALEELQSSNEEAVSSNEELQSVNEELQTAKEEVQSANEELATLNRELQDRNLELRQRNDALKGSEDEIRRALDYANAIVSTVRGPLLIMDGELRVEKANRAYYDTFSVRREETEGRLLYELGDGQWDFPSLRTALGEVLPKDSSFEGFEVDREFPEIGQRAMVLNARRLRSERGGSERILLAIEDRTELKRVEQGRDALLSLEQAARERAEAADHLKDEFVATVSHELRGPLTAMMGWMHVLSRGEAKLDPATLASGLAAINRGVKAQARLISDLLDHSRIVTGKVQMSRQLIDLATIAEAAVDSVRAAAQAKDIGLELWRDPRATIVMGDPDRMQQVLWNLFSNAVKFTPRGGRVQVWVGRVENTVHLRVTDTGQGIKEDFLPYVFERFRQAESSPRRSQPGLGLGLAIVRQLVEMHGGTVGAQSAGEGRGATFTVILPIPALLMLPTGAEEEDAGGVALTAQAEPAPDPEHTLLDGVSVLVVEDDADSRESLVRVLNQYGARVSAAGTAREAIEALEAAVPDVLVSDIGMAGEDGYDLIRNVRRLPAERGGRLPALAVTAYGEEGDRRKAFAAGFQAHVAKPVSPAELVIEVARLAGRAGAMAPSPPPNPS